MHLTTFFHVSDFSRLVKISTLFREQIVLELLRKRITQSFLLTISNRHILQSVQIVCENQISFPANIKCRFLGYDFYDDDSMVYLTDKEIITIVTPCKEYEWSGCITSLGYTLDDELDCRIYIVHYYNLVLQIYVDVNKGEILKFQFTKQPDYHILYSFWIWIVNSITDKILMKDYQYISFS
jgi:hypothetical protein